MLKYIFTTIMLVTLVWFAPVKGFAKDYSIKQMTPEVTVALENRRTRFDRLRELKSQKLIGENNQGYLSVLKHQTDINDLIEAENKDRRIIYQTIAVQNDLGEAIGVIEQIFARVQREKSSPGDQIQLENGSWVTK